MKNALILHGTNSGSEEHWFPWLKAQLEAEGYRVWVPDLPGADRPNAKRYTEFLLGNHDWAFNAQSILIGHSSGAVEILALLQALPESVQVDFCLLVGAFSSELAKDPAWENLSGLFETEIDYAKIKSSAKKLLFIHSDNDPYCPLEQAEYLADKTGAKLIVIPGMRHFSDEGDGDLTEFPDLLKIIIAGSDSET